LKALIRRTLRLCGFDLRRLPSGWWLKPTGKGTIDLGFDDFRDMRRFTTADRPIIFDVGANVGQTIQKFRKYFDNPEIHSFEPGIDTFAELKRNAEGLAGVHLVNCGLGAQREAKTFVENEFSDMSSFYEPGDAGWGNITHRREVQIDTIDHYCEQAGIDHIDILKSDTQGYDLEVLRGAENMLRAGKIKLVYLEIIFEDMYQGSPRFDEIYKFLVDHGMTLVSFYDMHYRQDRLSWTDVIFKVA
jgi:FkbM family methyltransferase